MKQECLFKSGDKVRSINEKDLTKPARIVDHIQWDVKLDRWMVFLDDGSYLKQENLEKINQ